jgi:hypothetical protein
MPTHTHRTSGEETDGTGGAGIFHTGYQRRGVDDFDLS